MNNQGNVLWAEGVAGAKLWGGGWPGGFESDQGGSFAGWSERRGARRWGWRESQGRRHADLRLWTVPRGKVKGFGAEDWQEIIYFSKLVLATYCIEGGLKGPWAGAGRPVRRPLSKSGEGDMMQWTTIFILKTGCVVILYRLQLRWAGDDECLLVHLSPWVSRSVTLYLFHRIDYLSPLRDFTSKGPITLGSWELISEWE